ncbi:LysR family transcriptional regulator [Aliivibrio sifiae]|uniref:HTH lysR-type domain-containing protein n=1 Tax=Aliivibrio sifiae TaxID=566293 RepID=A0A2S7XJA6_9GAMM|nr:LysR family transcriptional regulator [Aliivibrio sifiae]PQJ93809.1 hypothetical protein BTO23_06895 [Aliivibrio sifiae]GLR75242.1 hypothetical protein GCM10007855_21160 [Aliivibrio sifiae]
MQINQINAFLAIAKTGTLARASELVHATPAALSQRIKQLESRLGTEVFVRTNRGMQLSPQGLKIYDHAHSISQGMKDLVATLSEVDVNQERVNIAVSNAFNPIKLSNLTLSNEIENHKVNIRRMGDDSMLVAMKHSPIDIGIGFCSQQDDSIRSVYLGCINFVLVESKSDQNNGKVTKILLPNIPQLIEGLPIKTQYSLSHNDCYQSSLLCIKNKGYSAILEENFAKDCIENDSNLCVVGEHIEVPFHLYFTAERNKLINIIKDDLVGYLM